MVTLSGRKAIRVKVIPATNTKSERLSASDGDGNRILISRWSEASIERAIETAAQRLCQKMKWEGSLVGGWLARGEYVFVFTNERAS